MPSSSPSDLSLPDSGALVLAASRAAGGQQYPKATLYVVATPIGNLADLSLRAIHVLALADTVACEDSRVSAGLLRHLGLYKPLLAVHAHNEADAATGVIARLSSGERVAYVSDAGTPAISDPGARLVAAVAAAGHRVLPIPGASSAVTAVSVAGDVQGHGFRFVGFLPPKGAERSTALASCSDDPHTLVLFEAPHRIGALLEELAQRCPSRRVTVCRELTKQFETIITLEAAALPAWLAADAHHSRGEFVLVLHALPGEPTPTLAPGIEPLLQALIATLPVKQAVSLVADATGAPRNALYARALALKSAE